MSKKHRLFIAADDGWLCTNGWLCVNRRHPGKEQTCDLVVCKRDGETTWEIAPNPKRYWPTEYYIRNHMVKEKYGTMPIPRKKEYWC